MRSELLETFLERKTDRLRASPARLPAHGRAQHPGAWSQQRLQRCVNEEVAWLDLVRGGVQA